MSAKRPETAVGPESSGSRSPAAIDLEQDRQRLAAPSVMIVAGEASGDMHGANLVAALRRRRPALHCFGMGLARMRQAGVEIVQDASPLSLVGLVEILAHYAEIRMILERLRRLMLQRRPQLLILVDLPGFNLKLAQHAHRAGIRVLYYISPQVWAWRSDRLRLIKRSVDMMAVLFPFEERLYRLAEVPVRFVGHPLVDEVHSALDRAGARESLGLEQDRPLLGLFPGSRRGEIRRILPQLVAAAEELQQRRPKLQFALSLAPSLTAADLTPHIANSSVSFHVVNGRAYDLMAACDAIVCTSGTATLEVGLMGVPLAVVYRVAPLSYALLRRMIKIRFIGLVNIVAEDAVARELVQDQACPEAIADEAERLLFDRRYRERIQLQLAGLRDKLGRAGGAETVAELALELIESAPAKG